MTRFRHFIALSAMLTAATLAVAVTATTASAKGGKQTAGYTLDGYGALHPMTIGGIAAPAETAASVANHSWPGWNIARGMAEAQNHTDGVVLDGFGGLHGWGTDTSGNAAPTPSGGPYWGWDIARGVVLSSGNSVGYVLDGWGGVHPFGGAPAVTVTGYWPGWDIAKAIEMNPVATAGAGAFGCDVSGFVLDGYGGLHAFTDNKSAGDDASCAAPSTISVTISGYWSGWNIARNFVLDNDNKTANSGYVLDGWGGLHPWCANVSGAAACAPPAAVTNGPYWSGWDIARSISSTGTGSGWVLDGFGGIHNYGTPPAASGSGYSLGHDVFKDLDEN